ncbi:MAG: hypothetical protein KDC26_07630 [Armatimonadetes bacterium]|nr:hypothetical protein [Armatimonadota bacterium]
MFVAAIFPLVPPQRIPELPIPSLRRGEYPQQLMLHFSEPRVVTFKGSWIGHQDRNFFGQSRGDKRFETFVIHTSADTKPVDLIWPVISDSAQRKLIDKVWQDFAYSEEGDYVVFGRRPKGGWIDVLSPVGKQRHGVGMDAFWTTSLESRSVTEFSVYSIFRKRKTAKVISQPAETIVDHFQVVIDAVDWSDEASALSFGKTYLGMRRNLEMLKDPVVYKIGEMWRDAAHKEKNPLAKAMMYSMAYKFTNYDSRLLACESIMKSDVADTIENRYQLNYIAQQATSNAFTGSGDYRHYRQNNDPEKLNRQLRLVLNTDNEAKRSFIGRMFYGGRNEETDALLLKVLEQATPDKPSSNVLIISGYQNQYLMLGPTVAHGGGDALRLDMIRILKERIKSCDEVR